MKFRTIALATALFAPPKVNSQPVPNGNFTFVGSYASPLNDYLGGGSIVGDTLKLMVGVEEPGAYLASVPITRNGKLLTLFCVCVPLLFYEPSIGTGYVEH